MATFTGTTGQDTFIGSTTESNTFRFDAGGPNGLQVPNLTLNANDIVTGNPNAGFNDVLVFDNNSQLIVALRESDLVGVTHVETLQLVQNDTDIVLTDAIVEKSDNGFFT